jgi:hypothetical protein
VQDNTIIKEILILPTLQAAQSKRLNNISSSSSHTSALPLKRKACYDEDEEVQQVRKGIHDMSAINPTRVTE